MIFVSCRQQILKLYLFVSLTSFPYLRCSVNPLTLKLETQKLLFILLFSAFFSVTVNDFFVISSWLDKHLAISKWSEWHDPLNRQKDTNVERKSYTVIVSKQNGDKISVLSSQEIFLPILCNETTILSDLSLVLKIMLCKTLITQARTGQPWEYCRKYFSEDKVFSPYYHAAEE